MTEAPPILLPYQARWVADRSPIKIIEKSRRIGITWATSSEGVLEAAACNGEDVWYIGYNEDQGLEFIRDSAKWSLDLGAQTVSEGIEDTMIADERGDILAFRIRYASGFRVTSLTSRPRNLRGKQGYIIIDEAAFHDDLSELLKAAIAMLIWGGRVAIISTHFGADNAFAKFVDAVRAGVRKASLHRVTLDDALADGLYKRICLTTGAKWSADAEGAWRKELLDFYADDADEELLCIPSTGGGRYFPLASVQACATVSADRIVRLTNKGLLDNPTGREALVDAWCRGELFPVLQRIPTGLPCFLGDDFARTTDLSVLAVLGRAPTGKREIYAVVEMRNIPHEAQLQICEYVAHHVTLGGGAFDGIGNGNYLAEAMHERYGSIENVQITTQWYIDTMPPLRVAIEGGQVAIPRDDDSLDDLGQVRLHGGIPKLVPGRRATKNGARHGDFAIALAMAFSSSLDPALDRWERLMGEFAKKDKDNDKDGAPKNI